jgi:hypothetical protein
MRRTRRNRTKRNKRSSTRRKGGAATAFPLKYFNTQAEEPAASAGHDLLGASGMTVRPKIGGNRRTRRNKNRSRGGFVPSVMDGFVVAASKYITPIALFAGYKLMTRKGKKGTKRSSRRH